jgi:integrase
MDESFELIDREIEKANQVLKAGQSGVRIERNSGRLRLRATLPPAPGSSKTDPHQQRVKLGFRANMAGLDSAKDRAKVLTGQIADRTFDWGKWGHGPKLETDTIEQWVKQFEADHWLRHQRTQATEETWKGEYRKVFKRLPQGKTLTMAVLLELIAKFGADTRSRERFCSSLAQLAEFAGLPEAEKIRALTGGYSSGSVTPRELPEDIAIAQWRLKIPDRGWQWIYGMVAAYGLRPHEAFHADLSNFPEVYIPKDTKTGERWVYPLFPEWATEWALADRHLPGLHDIPSYSNVKLGTKAAGYFYERKFPFVLYDIRHCFSRRCFEFGFTAEMGAKLMGHSVAIHTRTYKAWIDRGVYRKNYEAVIGRPDRPLPPWS